MRREKFITAVLVVAGILTVAGCGGASSTKTTQAASQTHAVSPPAPAAMSLSVVGLPPQPRGGGPPPLPKRYTCDGANKWLSFKWDHVPQGTAELALFIVNLKPVNEVLFIDWAVAGLSPNLRGISTGKLPSGAVVGRDSFGRVGYSICPRKGKSEVYLARLVALPRPLHPQPGFDGIAFYQEANRAATTIGLEGAGEYSR